jgi:nitroimidazol reductase NimA-like FMN-containing flavoprotein (pyridoxamine 5'-phosphate oxidase superfamily)
VPGLQSALDRSYEQASAFTRSLFDVDRWDAAQVAAFVNAIRNITVSTVTARGEPHAAVVIGASLNEEIHFTVAPGSLMGRNLRRSPLVAFTICDRAHAVMGRGVAQLVARSLEAPELIQRLATVTKSGAFTPPGWDGLVYRIEIERIFAN